MWKRSLPLIKLHCCISVVHQLQLQPTSLDEDNFDSHQSLLQDTVLIYPNLAVLRHVRQNDAKKEVFREVMSLSENEATVEIADSHEEHPVRMILKTTRASYALRFEDSSKLLRCYSFLVASKSKVALPDFKPQKCLGRGKFGKVVSVQRRKTMGGDESKEDLHELLAVKEMVMKTKQDVKVCVRERLVLERVGLGSSPFLIKMKYAMLIGNQVYFAIELCTGGDLYTLQRSGEEFKFEGGLFYMAEVMEALKHLHSMNILYRDLKPENVLITGDGHVKIADFGLSRVLEGSDDKAMTICGTVSYFAPEMLQLLPDEGEPHHSQKKGYGYSVDYWAFAVFCFEIVMGRSPFWEPGMDPETTKAKILRADLEFPPDSSVRWKKLVSELLVPDVSARCGFQSGGGGPVGWDAVAAQPLFAGVDWPRLRTLQYRPPVAPLPPGGRDEDYARNFAPCFLQEPAAFCPPAADADPPPFPGPAFLVGFDYRCPFRITAEADRVCRRVTEQCLEDRRRFLAEEEAATAAQREAGKGGHRGGGANTVGSKRENSTRAHIAEEERSMTETLPLLTTMASKGSNLCSISERRSCLLDPPPVTVIGVNHESLQHQSIQDNNPLCNHPKRGQSLVQLPPDASGQSEQGSSKSDKDPPSPDCTGLSLPRHAANQRGGSRQPLQPTFATQGGVRRPYASSSHHSSEWSGSETFKSLKFSMSSFRQQQPGKGPARPRLVHDHVPASPSLAAAGAAAAGTAWRRGDLLETALCGLPPRAVSFSRAFSRSSRAFSYSRGPSYSRRQKGGASSSEAGSGLRSGHKKGRVAAAATAGAAAAPSTVLVSSGVAAGASGGGGKSFAVVKMKRRFGGLRLLQRWATDKSKKKYALSS